MKIESRIGKSECSDRKIFTFLTDFTHFKELLPNEKVTSWEASADKCSFHVDPVGRTTLEIIEKTADKLVKIASVPEFSAYQFTIWIQLKHIAENDTRVKITIEPLVTKMLLPVIKGPLKKFADGLIEKIESFEF